MLCSFHGVVGNMRSLCKNIEFVQICTERKAERSWDKMEFIRRKRSDFLRKEKHMWEKMKWTESLSVLNVVRTPPLSSLWCPYQSQSRPSTTPIHNAGKQSCHSKQSHMHHHPCALSIHIRHTHAPTHTRVTRLSMVWHKHRLRKSCFLTLSASWFANLWPELTWIAHIMHLSSLQHYHICPFGPTLWISRACDKSGRVTTRLTARKVAK